MNRFIERITGRRDGSPPSTPRGELLIPMSVIRVVNYIDDHFKSGPSDRNYPQYCDLRMSRAGVGPFYVDLGTGRFQSNLGIALYHIHNSVTAKALLERAQMDGHIKTNNWENLIVGPLRDEIIPKIRVPGEDDRYDRRNGYNFSDPTRQRNELLFITTSLLATTIRWHDTINLIDLNGTYMDQGWYSGYKG